MAKADANTIVVGIDGTLCGRNALQCAISEAARSGRRVLLVHAWSWAQDAVGGPLGAHDGRKEGALLLKRAARTARDQGVDAEIALMENVAPAEALNEAARGAAMLVVGAHGRRRLARAFLGSVSRACLEDSPCPVLIVPATSAKITASEDAEVVRG